MGRPLRHGFTTGACAAAAAKGAALMLRDQRPVKEVEILLPAGFAAVFPLHGQSFDDSRACCYVVKDAGDDPDVTNGVEVHAEVRVTPPSFGHPPLNKGGEAFGNLASDRERADQRLPPLSKGGLGGVTIEGGKGIGKVTKPGLAVPVGEWAINPVPRRMIEEALAGVFTDYQSPITIHCRLSIPDGLERARRTLNERLGIVGGLSILGTTGVVRPISHKAWTDTLEVALDVARAADCEAVVLSTGRTSELAAQKALTTPPPFGHPPCGTGGAGGGEVFPEEAFIMMGDHVGYALEACHRKGVPRILLAAQFAKLVKIACGHPQTHVGSSRLDLSRLADWARMDGLDGSLAEEIECANTAREVYESLGAGHPLAGIVAARALARLRQWAPGAAVAVLLVGYDGSVSRFGDWRSFRPLAREGKP